MHIDDAFEMFGQEPQLWWRQASIHWEAAAVLKEARRLAFDAVRAGPTSWSFQDATEEQLRNSYRQSFDLLCMMLVGLAF